MIDALLEALALKDVARTGWRRRGLDDVESVAAHSWGMALLVIVLCPPELNRERCLIYALLHDLAEAWTGDHPPQDGVVDKADREEAAMTALFGRLQRPDLLATWRDYEAQADAEARFVKQLDRLDMGLQAQRYQQRGLDPAEFLASARARTTPEQHGFLQDAAPVETSSVRFTGHPALVGLAAALAMDRLGGHVHVDAVAPETSQLLLDVLTELGLAPFRPSFGPAADLEITLTSTARPHARHLVWDVGAPVADLTSYRIARDAIRRRLDHVVAPSAPA